MCKALCHYKLTSNILNDGCNFVSEHTSGCCARNSNWRYSRQTGNETLTPNSCSDSKYPPNL